MAPVYFEEGQTRDCDLINDCKRHICKKSCNMHTSEKRRKRSKRISPDRHASKSLARMHGAQRALEIMVFHACTNAGIDEWYIRDDNSIRIDDCGLTLWVSDSPNVSHGYSDFGAVCCMSFSARFITERQGVVMAKIESEIKARKKLTP